MRQPLHACCGAFALLLVLVGCRTPSPGPARPPPVTTRGPLAVPFIAQKPGYCGPAALAMVANYYGHHVTQDEIAQEIYLPAIHGTLTSELTAYARRFNLWVRSYRGSPADLREKLAAGLPLIVLGRFGDHDHYFVVLDLDPFNQTVIVHSDARPQLAMPAEEFFRCWDRAERWTLLVCPPAQARWNLSADEHNDLGVFLEKNGQWPEAVAQYRAALASCSKNCDQVWLNLGNALRREGQLREAAAAFAHAIKLASDPADAMNNLADIYLALNEDLDEAERLCREAARRRPDHRAYYLDTRGSILVKQGQPRAAAAAFTDALAATTDRQTALRATIRAHLEAVAPSSPKTK